MRAIRQRNHFFAGCTVFGIAVSAVVFAGGVFAADIWAYMLPAVGLSLSGISAGLWIREYKRLKTARLIVENQILCIQPAVIIDETCGIVKSGEADSIEVFVSYFGLLLESKIIRFNQDGVRLKAVEIRRDSIVLTYGTENWVQSTRLLRPAAAGGELEEIAERFRFETGVIPTIIH